MEARAIIQAREFGGLIHGGAVKLVRSDWLLKVF